MGDPAGRIGAARGQPERVREATALPAGDFHLELVDLVGTNILPPELKWLTGLTRLRVLNLPGPMWNPSSGATIDYSRDLRHIAGIPTLEELTFSYTYLESIKFEDAGIEEIAALAPSLRLLSLENTQVRGRHLGPFTNLEALDLVYCPVDDEGLKQIGGLTKLRKLLLARRRDQRRRPGQPEGPDEPRAAGPGGHENQRRRRCAPARDDEAEEAEPAECGTHRRRDPAPGGHDSNWKS